MADVAGSNQPSYHSLVASTFSWLVIPLHIALTALLVFILQIMEIFQSTLANIQDVDITGVAAIPATPFGGYSPDETSIFVWLVAIVVLVLTAANAFAPKAAEGGHPLKLLYNLAIMALISGANFLLVPRLVDMIFSNVSVV